LSDYDVKPPAYPARVPTTDSEREAIREQVGRVLASSLFRNSRRIPNLLKYTVEKALRGEVGENLKERTLGVEVFGRAPDYDTAQDPVVRMTAVEIRKRLAQYYRVEAHEQEIRICFPAGSYVPEFHAPDKPLPLVAQPAGIDHRDAPAKPAGKVHRRTFLGIRIDLFGAAALSALAMAMLVLGRPWVSNSALDLFWSPIRESRASVLLCIGDGRLTLPPTDPPAVASVNEPTVMDFLRGDSVRLTDAVTLALLAGQLRAMGKPFRIRRTEATQLQDLRDGPAILIGGSDNPWTIRLTEGLRFGPARDSSGYIRDRQNPSSRVWNAGEWTTPLTQLKEAYGIASRVLDPTTGQFVVIAGGLLLGTKAAGECLLDRDCLEDARRRAPGDWKRRNIQIVVATKMIGTNSSPPRVVAAHLW
jgi:hypothetical protein